RASPGLTPCPACNLRSRVVRHLDSSSKESAMPSFTRLALGAALALAATATLAADLKIGLSTSLSGPNSSIGIPYANGMKAAVALRPEIGGRKVQLIVLDDGSDPSAAARNARKLVDDEKVDVLMGTSGVP